MIIREDILSLEFLKKTEYSGSHNGMRFRLERVLKEAGNQLLVTVWPEPFNFIKTPEEEKTSAGFEFTETGIVDAITWMNCLFMEEKERWEYAGSNRKNYEEQDFG